jgi:hypothetical protein
MSISSAGISADRKSPAILALTLGTRRRASCSQERKDSSHEHLIRRDFC